MPSFADSAVIFVLALILFGPKKLPQLARQLGKLMAEFRRASNEFRMQMEDELRIEEQKEHQKKVDAIAGPPSTLAEPEHPHLPDTSSVPAEPYTIEQDHASLHDGNVPVAPIAESGSLRMMPPSTGLPVESGSFGRSNLAEESGAADTYANHEPHPQQTEQATGMSSDEPMHDMMVIEEQTHA